MKTLLGYALLLLSCSVSAQDSPYLIELLKSRPAEFSAVLAPGNPHEVQIIYTEVLRDANGRPHFSTHTYGVSDSTYFYPASTVKMPLAFLALEKLHELRIRGLDRNTPMLTEAGSTPQVATQIDTSAAGGLPSVAHYIKKIFLVSDNAAFNRLYEFLGQAAINERLHAKGYTNTRIVHRLGDGGPSFDTLTNQFTNPVRFVSDDTLRYYQGEVRSRAVGLPALQQELRGVGYARGDAIIDAPFDFSRKNYVHLRDLHDMLQAVIFPTAVPEHRRFRMSAADREFLLRYMSMRPRESRSPRYDKPDNYVKFFWHGDDETKILPDHIRIYNKVGWAYGWLTDVSYVHNEQSGREFLVAATIHVNANQIYNDGVYEYETIGLPFFARLGALLLGTE